MPRQLLLLGVICLLLTGCDADLDAALASLGDRSQEYAQMARGTDDLLKSHTKPNMSTVASFGKQALPGLSKLLTSGTTEQKWDAAIAAALIGKDAAGLEAKLLSCAQDPKLEEAAFLALIHVAPESKRFRALAVARFREPEPPAHAIYAIVLLSSPLAAPDRKRMLALATDLPERSETSMKAFMRDKAKAKAARRRGELAAVAAWALGKQGKASSGAVPALAKAAPRGGREYFDALARIDTPPAREALEKLLGSEDGRSSRYALSALCEIDPVPEVVWKTLEAGLASDRPGLALGTIRSMGARARRLVPKVLPLLADSRNRWGAVQALESVGKLSPEARAALLPLADDPDEHFRGMVRDLLKSDGQ